MVDVESQEWKKCCDIIDKLIEIGDSDILGDVIRMLCANSYDNSIDLLLGQYGEIIE